MTTAVSLAQQVAPGVSLGFKNRLINGAFNVAQRGTSFSLSAGVTTYTLDRWYVNTTGGTGSVAQTGSVGANSLQITGASGVSSAFFGQKIESNNIADLAGYTVTCSIKLSSSTLSSVTWYARFPTAQDNYAAVTLISSGTINLTSTPTQYTFNIALPAGAANGLEVFFLTGAFTSGTLTASRAQLEVGTAATNFEFRDYGRELIMCQRYYEVYAAAGNATLYRWYGGTGTEVSTVFPMQVTKRIAPTISGGAVTQSNCSATSFGDITINSYRLLTNTVLAGMCYFFFASNITMNAEL